MHMKRTADRLFGDEYHWSVLGAGAQPDADRRAWPRRWAATCASGLEDSLWIGPGKLAEIQRRAGRQGAPDHRGPRPGDRHARRGAHQV